MPERPLLLLPSPTQPAQRAKKRGFPGSSHFPARERQVQRLTPLFTTLQQTFETRRVRIQTEATGLIPEDVIVLETIGDVGDFLVAIRGIPGMEWLGEVEEEDIPPDDDFFEISSDGKTRREKQLHGRLFMVFTNQQALSQMLSLWHLWQQGKPFGRGLAVWNNVFFQLRDIRPWGIRDRLLETGVLQDWQDRVEHNEEIIPCEIELWFRKNPQSREGSRRRVANLVAALQGQVLHETSIEQISYHAMLVHLPVAAVEDILNHNADDTALVQCEQIQFFRATGQMAVTMPDNYQLGDAEIPLQPMGELGNPVVALFDGLPLQNHHLLAGRIIIDDPENFEAQYQSSERRHGTAMASLIVNGDLNEGIQPLNRKIYVRPILRPDGRDWRQPREETAPGDRLLLDLIYRAVRRLFEGDSAEPATAPDVCVINLSIGIRDRLFDGSLSPLARLLDWLSWTYGVLFIVSAGNHQRDFHFDIPREEFLALNEQEKQQNILRYIASDARHRRLLSPAEGINVLTVASVHDDASGHTPVPRALHPFSDSGLPSVINAQGMGFRRAIKPEILLSGGRVVLIDNMHPSHNANFSIYHQGYPPGQCVAHPGTHPGDLNATIHTRGTSNATALASRAASRLFDTVSDLRGEQGGAIIDVVPRALWIKNLLVHSAGWGNAGSVLQHTLRTPENSRQFREYVTRLLGYGNVQLDRVSGCAPFRVTALGGGLLQSEQAHIHEMPLPPSLSGRQCWRRLVITLSWLSPVNPSHQSWRRAALWFSPPDKPLQVTRQQASWQAVTRGTVQHEVLEGADATVFVDGEKIAINVNCRPDAGTLEEPIPYSLAVTLEIGQEIGIDIYNEVKIRVQQTLVEITPHP